MDRASQELDRWIERVRNWTGRLSESGTGQELDEQVRNWTSKSGTGQVGRASLELDRKIE